MRKMRKRVVNNKRKRENDEPTVDETIKRSCKEMKVEEMMKLSPISNPKQIDPSPRKDVLTLKLDNLKQDLNKDEDFSDEDGEESYELIRKKNIEDNAKFLSKIGLYEAKQQLNNLIKKPKKAISQRGLQRKNITDVPLTRRKSLRIARIDPDGNSLPESIEIDTSNDRPTMPPECPIDIVATLLNEANQDYHQKLSGIISSTKVSTKLYHSSELQSYLKEIKHLQLSETGVAKVVPTRVFSLAVHPTTDQVLFAVGGKWGGVGLWNTESQDSQDGVVAYKPHISPVNWVSFHQDYPAHLYSCSYDGSCRYADYETGKFFEIYAVPADEDILLRNADFITPQTMLVSQSDGCVAIIDRRTASTTAESLYRVHQKALRTVSIHPNGNNFCTASLDATLKTWDIRRMKVKNNMYISEGKHGRIVNSAYFSPITGKYILSTSDDNYLHIYDVDDNQNIKLKKCIRHNNHTGRWLTKFRASWHPAREDVFVVGSMARPRQIEVFCDKGSIVQTYQSEDYLGSVCSINTFHPTLNILAGANSSGRVHVFR